MLVTGDLVEVVSTGGSGTAGRRLQTGGTEESVPPHKR